MSNRRHTYTPPTDQDWCDAASCTSGGMIPNANGICRIVMDLAHRLSALERAKASQPAPEQPTTPAAGVDGVRDFLSRMWNSPLDVQHKEFLARDAAISKAARERAIGECIEVLRNHGLCDLESLAALRTLANKEQPREQ